MKTSIPVPKQTAAAAAFGVAMLLALARFPVNGQSDFVGHWKFDEGSGTTAADSSTYGNHGTLLGGPAWVSGQFSNALSFDGLDDYVEVPNSPILGITGDLTIAAWIKRGALLDYGGIVAKTDGANYWDYDFYFTETSDNLHFYSDIQSPIDVVSSGSVSDMEWHHVAVTRNGSTITFYIDGVSAGSASIGGSSANNPVPVRIGTDGPDWSGGSMFDGLIDDVRIYNRALSQEEIQGLYPGLSYTIAAQPADVTEAVGYTASFTVRVSPPLGVTYQWYRGADPIAGANAATYTTALLTLNDSGSQYQVFVNDTAGGNVAVSRIATLTVVAPVFSPGFLKREVYNNIAGVLVSDLTGSAKYPNAPDGSGLVGGFESPLNVGNDYGQRLSGFLTPTETTNYIFFIAADDQAELWLSLDQDPANKALIAREPAWNPSRDWIGTDRRNAVAPENQSAPILLQAGQRYYVEALHKEGGGADNLAVTAIKQGDPLPASASAPLQGTFLGTFGAPSTTTVTFASQPANVVTAVGRTATFAAAASSSSSPIVYQWQRNGADIFKANAPAYPTPPLSLSDSGTQYRCIAYIRGGASATSAVATVTVSSDVTPPIVLRVHALGDPTTGEATQVTVTFDEPVEQTRAEDSFSYRIDDGAISVTAAVLQPDLKRVILSTAPLAPGVDHALKVTDVRDRTGGNVIVEATTLFRTTQLIARYLFEDPANPAADSAGGNDGALVGGPILVAGQNSKAMSFDGLDDYVNVPNQPDFGLTADITIAAWLKRDALFDRGGIVAKTDGANVWDYDLYFTPGHNRLLFYSDATGPDTVGATGQIADLAWHHVAVTRSGTTVTFYIDGEAAGTATMSGSFANNPLPVRIGTDGPTWDSGSMFRGSLDDVRIYNRALSSAEIQQLMTPLRLNLTLSVNELMVSWPAAALDVVLEFTASLSPASWMTVTDTSSVVGNQKTQSLPIVGSAGFYRLRNQ